MFGVQYAVVVGRSSFSIIVVGSILTEVAFFSQVNVFAMV